MLTVFLYGLETRPVILKAEQAFGSKELRE